MTTTTPTMRMDEGAVAAQCSVPSQSLVALISFAVRRSATEQKGFSVSTASTRRLKTAGNATQCRFAVHGIQRHSFSNPAIISCNPGATGSTQLQVSSQFDLILDRSGGEHHRDQKHGG